MRVVIATFWIVLSLILIAFALLNAESVEVSYVFGKQSMPLSLTMLLCFLVGGIVGVCWSVSWVLRERSRAHQLSKKCHVLQKEIDNLRSVPLKDAKQWS